MSLRIKKLTNAGLARDQQISAIIKPLSQAYEQRRLAHAAKGIIDPDLANVRWMIEELRVSLFAQELKTAFHISPQRLEKLLSLVTA